MIESRTMIFYQLVIFVKLLFSCTKCWFFQYNQT